MSWTEFKTLVTSRFTPEYEYSCGSGVVGFEANTFDQNLRGEVLRGCEHPSTCVGLR